MEKKIFGVYGGEEEVSLVGLTTGSAAVAAFRYRTAKKRRLYRIVIYNYGEDS